MPPELPRALWLETACPPRAGSSRTSAGGACRPNSGRLRPDDHEAADDVQRTERVRVGPGQDPVGPGEDERPDRQPVELQPPAGRQQLGVARGQAGHQEGVHRQAAQGHRHRPIGRQARHERALDADPGVRVEDDADHVGGQEGHHEHEQVLVPREQPLRQLPGRLVDRVAEDEAERDEKGQQDVGGHSRRPTGQPEAHLGLVLARCGDDLVGREDDEQTDESPENQDDRSAQAHGRGPLRAGWCGCFAAAGGVMATSWRAWHRRSRDCTPVGPASAMGRSPAIVPSVSGHRVTRPRTACEPGATPPLTGVRRPAPS